jgi:serine protease Do
MKSFLKYRKLALAVPGVALIVLGVALAVRAQSGPVEVFRFDADGGYLGVEMEEVTAENMATYKLTAERGVIVKSVEKGSPAEQSGIQPKDVILDYAGMPVFSSLNLQRLVRETPVGRKVDVALSRDGKRLNVSVKVGKREGPLTFDGRRMQVLPHGSGQGFSFDWPGGRGFGFQTPEGPNFQFDWPGQGRAFAFSDRPRLGVTLQPLSDQMAEFLGVPGKQGVLVTAVNENSPAAGKMKAGDVIVRADSESIDGTDDLSRVVRGKDAGSTLQLKVIRDKKEITIDIVLPGTESRRRGGTYRL